MAAAFENYFQSSTLMGTPGKCARLIERLAAKGVDETACLIDFGVDADAVLASLVQLNELTEHSAAVERTETRAKEEDEE